MKSEKSIYFPGINGLRFLAALAVIITHIELSKRLYSYPANWKNPIIYSLGGLGVYFFFVLSGFLITYLLLVEKQKKGEIRIKRFYVRRVLRIWPLYYLIVLLGFFVLPYVSYIHLPDYVLIAEFFKNFDVNLVLYLLILPNLAFSMFMAVPHIGQTWSIGVEEQFYLFWPWVIAKSKNVLRSLIMIISGLLLLKVGVLVAGKFFPEAAWYTPLQKFVAMSKFECMAIGGIGAYLVFVKHRILNFLYNKYVTSVSILLIPALIFLTPESVQNGIHIVYSFIFLIVILNVANGSVKINLENKVFDYLGKISYGIYMYHFMVIPFVLRFCAVTLNLEPGTMLNCVLYPASVLATVGVSSLSFELFENRFIKLKSKFTVVKSGSKD